MLLVDARRARRESVETIGQLDPSDAAFAGLDLHLAGPVAVHGRLQSTGEDEFLWRATVAGVVRGECRRCLRELAVPVDIAVDVLFSADPDAADDPSVYPLTPPVQAIDVGAAVREELALAAPTYLLCRDDCPGLCPRCGADLNAGSCVCAAPAEPV